MHSGGIWRRGLHGGGVFRGCCLQHWTGHRSKQPCKLLPAGLAAIEELTLEPTFPNSVIVSFVAPSARSGLAEGALLYSVISVKPNGALLAKVRLVCGLSGKS